MQHYIIHHKVFPKSQGVSLVVFLKNYIFFVKNQFLKIYKW